MPCKNHPDALEGLVKCTRCGEFFCKDCVIELKGDSFCATCKEEHVKDVQSGADTTQLELASVGRRFVALFLDGLILIVPLVVIAMVFGFMAATQMNSEEDLSGPFAGLQLILQLIYIGIGVVYEGVMLQSRGQTLGKMALKIKVVTPDGSTISGGQAWGRPLARYLMGLVPLLSLVDYLFAFSKEKTTLHDKIARTRVINWR